ncbi:unnamed protein product, partial [Cylindrotheca closterium]
MRVQQHGSLHLTLHKTQKSKPKGRKYFSTVSTFHRLYKKAWRQEVFGNQAFTIWSSRTAEHSGQEISKCPGWWAEASMDQASDVHSYNDIAVFILTGLKAYDPSLGVLMPQLWSSMQNLLSLGDLEDANDDEGSWALCKYFLRSGIIPPIVEEFKQLERESKIAKALSKSKKRLASTPENPYGAWFRDFAVKTKAYAAIASTDTAAQNKFKDDIFEAVLATGFLC